MVSTPVSALLRALVDDLKSVAGKELGPHSESFLNSTDTSTAWVLHKSGLDHLDVALSLVFRELQNDQELHEGLRNEFYSVIYSECLFIRGATRELPLLNPVLETHDLLGEVILQLLRGEVEYEFRGRAPLASFVTQRVKWLASQASKGKYKESPSGMSVSHLEQGTPSGATSFDQEDFLTAQELIGRLHPRDRSLIEAWLLGESSKSIADLNQMTSSGVRKRIQRALEALRASNRTQSTP